jgi:hypothetical protein
LAIEPVNK